jgi:DNA helicase-2/ATP-dependent DNA helicase PcrA
LRVFVQSLRDYKKKEFIKLSDLIEFVELHQKNGICLANNSAFVSNKNSVNLLTVHKAKGMEFNTVFVLNCNDRVWAKTGKNSKLPFPKNLSIKPIGDSKDDQLRLFYVAITRAGDNLYLTSHKYNDLGKEFMRLSFLDFIGNNLEVVNGLEEDKVEHLIVSWEDYHNPPFELDDKKILKNFLNDYKLNVTHLNNFLDVTNGGPLNFFKQNILRFPQAKTGNSSFGTSVHNTINEIYKYLKNNNKKPNIKDIDNWFERLLRLERLGDEEFKLFLKKGKYLFEVFYKEKIDEINQKDLSEFNFYNEGVFVGDVPLSGKIDKMVFKDKGVLVCDFKTGKLLDDWDKGSEYEKIKSWKYKNQLLFYKLLIENSRTFDGYKVDKGYLEFLEPKNNKIVDLYLDLKNEDIERLKNVIVNVYKKIINLDFPDVSEYEDNIKGIEKFEEDILNSE